MKWNKAIEQIEKALADGKRVEVSFHRKWARNCNEYKTDSVESVGAYDWHGETCKGVSTFEGYGLDEGNFIIDDVIVADEQTEEPTVDIISNLTYDEDGTPCITLGGCEADQEEPSVGDVVEICGVKSIVTSVENYGFFVKGRDGIVLYSDDYKIIRDAIVEVSRPKLTWTYLYTDTTAYNVDMDVYRTEDGRLVMVDSDWMF